MQRCPREILHQALHGTLFWGGEGPPPRTHMCVIFRAVPIAVGLRMGQIPRLGAPGPTPIQGLCSRHTLGGLDGIIPTHSQGDPLGPVSLPT